MSPFCKIRCEDCGPYLVADPDFITIFFLFEVLGRGPSYMLAGMCPYCNRGIVENISEEDARRLQHKGVCIFNWLETERV